MRVSTCACACVLVQVAVLAAVAASGPCAIPLHKVDNGIEGRYVVTFLRNATGADVEAYTNAVAARCRAADAGTSQVTGSFSVGARDLFRGFAASLSPALLAEVRGCGRDAHQATALHPARRVVDYVTPDATVSVPANETVHRVARRTSQRGNTTRGAAAASSCSQQTDATWGLVRTTQRSRDLNGRYKYDSAPETEVDVYVVDTGIYTEHDEFEGRAEWGVDVTTDNSPKTDQSGHGTHVAGTIAGRTFGVAKTATVIAVRVLGADGSGTMSGVIAGVAWTCADHKDKGNKCVVNMSLGGGKYDALNNAVKSAIECGCQFTVAAGNSAGDACYGSPSSSEDAVTVMASDMYDHAAYYSDYGQCCDLYAPGSSITSAWIGSPNTYATISGTSMAAPHVAGIMATILGSGADVAPEALKELVLGSASSGYVSSIPSDTPNVLVYKACE